MLLAVISLALFSCKSEFEKIRASGDVDRIYQKALVYYEAEEYQKAQTLFEIIISSFRGKREAEEIYFKYAYTFYHLEQYIMATYYFKNFATTYATSELRMESDFMTAYSSYQLSPTFRLDQKYTQDAINAFQLFVNTYPDSDRVEQCNNLIDAMRAKLEVKAFEGAKLYFDMREYQAAIQSFENVLKDFPDTQNAEEVEHMIVRSAYLLATNSFVEKQWPRYRDVVARSEEFLGRYGEGRWASEVRKMNEESVKALNNLKDVGYQDESTGAGS